MSVADLGPLCPGCSKEIPLVVMKRAAAEHKDLRCSCGALRSWRSLPKEVVLGSSEAQTTIVKLDPNVKRVLLDMDGVLVDLCGGICEFHKTSIPGIPHSPHYQSEQIPYGLESILGMTEDELWSPLGFEFWSRLEPLPWCFDVVNALEHRFGSDNICLLSSPTLADGCIDGKMAWIRHYLPGYNRRFLIGPQKQFTASPQHCLMDDYAKNIDQFTAAGGVGFLFPAPWNQRFKEEPLAAVCSWLEGPSTAS